MDSLKTITICVSIYGVEQYIEKCARSLFCQKYPHVEYIFVNDGTQDDSIRILEGVIADYPSLAGRVKIINHDTNLGLAAARLTGLNHATGEYVWFVDADDWVEEDALAKLQAHIHEGHDLIVFSFYEEQGATTCVKKVENVTVSRVLLHRVPPSIWKCIIRRDVLFRHSLQPVTGINYFEDFFMLSRLVLVSSRIATLSDLYLYHYNCMNTTSMMNTNAITAKEQCAYAADLVFRFYAEHGADAVYGKELSVMMTSRYLDLYEADAKHDYCDVLKQTIRRHSFCAYLLLLLPVHVSVKRFALRLYTKCLCMAKKQ